MLLDLRYYGDPHLRKKCLPVEEINDEIRKLAGDLTETVFHFDGAGLSAPQVGSCYRIFVVRFCNTKDREGGPVFCEPCIYINPLLSNPSEEQVTLREGCLSIPGIYSTVSRPRTIDVTYMDLAGNSHRETAIDWRARAVMHENDHLNGVLNIDRMTMQTKKKIRSTLRQIKKKYAISPSH